MTLHSCTSLGPLSVVVVLFACTAPPSGNGPSQPQPAEGAVLEVTDAFFRALSAGDTATLAALVAPGAALHSVRMAESGPVVRARTREGFLSGIGEGHCSGSIDA